MRYPLVDGQWNFGNIDGDSPAASRYTEARLAEPGSALMEGLAEDAVEFRPNYDGTLTEPVVLPAAYPNLLCNGASGIAVGMATNIPPHNLHEVVDACLHLIKSPDARDETLLNFVQVDFQTGGVSSRMPRRSARPINWPAACACARGAGDLAGHPDRGDRDPLSGPKADRAFGS